MTTLRYWGLFRTSTCEFLGKHNSALYTILSVYYDRCGTSDLYTVLRKHGGENTFSSAVMAALLVADGGLGISMKMSFKTELKEKYLE